MKQTRDSPAPFDIGAVTGTMPGSIDAVTGIEPVPLRAPAGRTLRVAAGTSLAVQGWAVDEDANEPPRAACVVLDRVRVYEATTGFGRFDVKADLGPDTPENVGFRAIVETGDLAPAIHELRAYALAANGTWCEAGACGVSVYRPMRPELGVRSDRVNLSVDAVLDISDAGVQGPLRGVVPLGRFATVYGWAFVPRTGLAPAGVCAVDDAGGRWNAPCDVARDDVRSAFGAADGRLGFEIAIPSESLGRGHHTLRVWAFDADGAPLGQPVKAEVDVAAEVRAFPGFARERAEPVRAAAMVTVAKREPRVLRAGEEYEIFGDELVGLEGWAVAPDGEPAEQILLELRAGESSLPYRYHPISCYERRDAPKRLPTPPRPDAWFAYRLDPSDLPPRTYVVTAVVLGKNRLSYARGELGRLRVAGDSPASVRRT